MHRIEKILPHISIVLSGMVIIFFVIDRFNNSMALLEDDVAKVLILFLGISSILTSSLLVSMQRREERRNHRIGES